MAWKRVRRAGGGEEALELEPISGAVAGPAPSWFLVPEDEASDCCWRVNEKPSTDPDTDPQDGFLVVPADHVEEAHPDHVD